MGRHFIANDLVVSTFIVTARPTQPCWPQFIAVQQITCNIHPSRGKSCKSIHQTVFLQILCE